jgi:hypothetical protein
MFGCILPVTHNGYVCMPCALQRRICFGKQEQALAMHEDDDHHHDATEPAGHHDEHNKPGDEKTHDTKKSCGEGKGCSCCNQHPNYVIKENTSGSVELQMTVIQVAILPVPYQHLAPVPGVYENKTSWLNCTGPPGTIEHSLFIKYRSLLI